MKFIVSMKNPDTLHDAIAEACEKITIDGIDANELELIRSHRGEEVLKLCRTWFEYGEYLRVEIDTELKTCTVVPVKPKP